MPQVETCRNCRGKGRVKVARTNKDGKTVYVDEDCPYCRGSGVIPR